MDLVMLDVMNEPLILYTLKERFQKNGIYTNVGTILISINPYKRLPLYTPQVIDEYMKRGNRKLDPHIYMIADDSFRNMRESMSGPSIVISGESGAGKTECTKQCLQYLAEIAGSSTNVEQRILLANPILEAFGNAKTVRNNNSSRFGKYVEIFFDNRSSICGASNTNYLLEKSRVVMQAPNERNYHVFYQLIAGIELQNDFCKALKKALKLKDAEEFNFLNQSGVTTVDTINDEKDWEELIQACDVLNMSLAEKTSTFHIVR